MKKSVVLVVEDNTMSAKLAFEALGDCFDVRICTCAESALDFCDTEIPDLILMDIHLPDKDGLSACRLIKENSETAHVPVIFLTSETTPSIENMCWTAQCADFITKPYSIQTLRNRVRSHINAKLMHDKLKRQASIDGLTGVFNRHFLDQFLPEQIKLSKRDKTPLGLLMLDIDYFKQYNDNYGHLAGDEALKRVANAIERSLTRPTDHVVRFGGEEFTIVLPNTTREGVHYVAKRVDKAIQQLIISHADSPFKLLTVSIGGIASYSSNLDALDYLALVDQQLYLAKESGRNGIKMNSTSHYGSANDTSSIRN